MLKVQIHSIRLPISKQGYNVQRNTRLQCKWRSTPAKGMDAILRTGKESLKTMHETFVCKHHHRGFRGILPLKSLKLRWRQRIKRKHSSNCINRAQ